MPGKMNVAVLFMCFMIFDVAVQITQADFSSKYTECLSKCIRDEMRGSESSEVPSRDCVIRCDSELAKAEEEELIKKKYPRRTPH
ncbi:hypothetical protein MKW92_042516 [Papaver armeniacum]|nr:hypothetical protein MKW92_042516 [Papaver armeniacum]